MVKNIILEVNRNREVISGLSLNFDGYTRAYEIISHAAVFERYIATFIVCYVAVRFIGHYFKISEQKSFNPLQQTP